VRLPQEHQEVVEGEDWHQTEIHIECCSCAAKAENLLLGYCHMMGVVEVDDSVNLTCLALCNVANKFVDFRIYRPAYAVMKNNELLLSSIFLT